MILKPDLRNHSAVALYDISSDHKSHYGSVSSVHTHLCNSLRIHFEPVRGADQSEHLVAFDGQIISASGTKRQISLKFAIRTHGRPHFRMNQCDLFMLFIYAMWLVRLRHGDCVMWDFARGVRLLDPRCADFGWDNFSRVYMLNNICWLYANVCAFGGLHSQLSQ